jgi:tetratricopeptide (TPR) repeat protein
MEVVFDNSADNPRNPSQPPKRVRQGPQTTDEMAQITFQVLARNENDRRQLLAAHLKALTLDAVAYNESLLRENPSLAEAHAKLGQALLPLGRHDDAAKHLREAIRLDPSRDKPYYDLGTLFLLYGRLPEARAAFEAVLKLNPSDYQAHGNLGAIFQREGHAALAERHFREALRLNPRDAAAARALEALRPSGSP